MTTGPFGQSWFRAVLSGAGGTCRLLLFVVGAQISSITPALASTLGTFVAGNPTEAILLQLVRGSRNRLLGHYEEVDLQHGRIVVVNAQVAGAIDRNTLVLTLKPSEILAPAISLSGSLSGDRIALTGGGNGTVFNIVLVRGSLHQFQGYVATLDATAARIQAAQVERNFQRRQSAEDQATLKRLTTVERWIREFGPLADAREQYLVLADRRYRQITMIMQSEYDRERTIIAGYMTESDRSRVWVGIDQYFLAAGRVHLAVQRHHQLFENSRAAITVDIAKSRRSCNVLRSDPDIAAASDQSSITSACTAVRSGVPALLQEITDLAASYAKAEAVWKGERRRQHEILGAAQQAISYTLN